MAEGTNELLQLWTSVSSALCGCVNNPQNGTHTYTHKFFYENYG